MYKSNPLIPAVAMWASGIIGLMGAGVFRETPPYAMGVTAWAATAIFVLASLRSHPIRQGLSTIGVGWIGLALAVCASGPVWIATPGFLYARSLQPLIWLGAGLGIVAAVCWTLCAARVHGASPHPLLVRLINLTGLGIALAFTFTLTMNIPAGGSLTRISTSWPDGLVVLFSCPLWIGIHVLIEWRDELEDSHPNQACGEASERTPITERIS